MSDLETKVRTCVQSFIATKAEFTAYDVTQELRKLDSTTDIPHANGVREIVHALFESDEMPEYSRELDHSFSVSLPPWRYYFDGVVSQTTLTIPDKTTDKSTVKSVNCCSKPLQKKGFGLYQVQRYRCLVCGKQQNEYSNSVFHNRKHRPATILDAFWCLANNRDKIYTANAVNVNYSTIRAWCKVAKETWLNTSRLILSLDQRFDKARLNKLKGAL